MFDVIKKHAPKYLTASSIATLVTLLMTKYYTFIFSPSEFGILALYLVMFQYIVTLVSLNMDSSSTRLYFDYRETKRDEYLSTIFWFITFSAIIVILIALFFMDFISNWIHPNSENIYIITLFSGIGAVYVSFLMRVLYNEQKSNSVLKHTLFQTFINHASSIALISIFNLGIWGRMAGQGLGYFLNSITLFKEFSKANLFKVKMVFNRQMASETFMLSLPIVIASFQTIVFIYLDRFFLKHFIGDASVGIYTLGYMLGQGLSLVYEAIAQAILPKMFNDMNNDYIKARDELEKFSYKYYFGLILVTFLISLSSPIIVMVFSNDSYSQAAEVMPFIMAGFMIGGFYKVPALVLAYHKKVWFYPFFAFFSFGINALLNWWLIPDYGTIGAAYASFVGFFINSLFIAIFSMKFLTKKFSIFLLVMYFISFAVMFLLFWRYI